MNLSCPPDHAGVVIGDRNEGLQPPDAILCGSLSSSRHAAARSQ